MKKGDIGKHKFCPVCGTKLEIDDAFCTKCGYAFAQRDKPAKKAKWRNIIILIIIIFLAYAALNYFSGKPILPGLG